MGQLASARLADHDRYLAVRPRLVGLEVGVEVDEQRPQPGTLGSVRRDEACVERVGGFVFGYVNPT